MTRADEWDILQIEATKDKREIKRAYAHRSKEIHPEEKPEEFQNLYEAYQNALKYASYGEIKEKKEINSETEQKPEDTSVSGENNRYRELGLDFEKRQEEQLRIERIKCFQKRWNGQIFEQEQGGEFLNENWKEYLQSEAFQEIMWSPIILEIIAEGVLKYFQQKKEIVLFFCRLYKIDEPEEENGNAICLYVYMNLYPAYIKSSKRQQIQTEWIRIEKIKYFQSCWKKQIFVWENGGMFLSEDWKAYLQSEAFQEIMWSSSVQELIEKGMLTYGRKEEMVLFFWKLYGFEASEEEYYNGRNLRLFRCLYPAYTNFLKRQQYAKDKDRVRKGEHRRIWLFLIIWICVGILVYTICMIWGSAAIWLAGLVGVAALGAMIWLIKDMGGLHI